MESKRQQKVSSLLQQELATVFQRDLPHLFPGLAPGIVGVRVSPDLGVARVYLSQLLMREGSGQEMLDMVHDNQKLIRQALAKRVRQTLRIVPDLVFFLDDSAAYAAKMDEVFGKLDIPNAEPDANEQPDAEAPKRPRLFKDDSES
ncbi:30S ribosome-binding factor RbfA [Hymenobacter sp. BT186]|uniref:Ribosome-binding factor A n=1 Tax=Hymenobacter telluris TaxID=2816474 RepID=A0A939JC03_9BACT|nr:30S ribosome-binding factor RbfA [Hymenobacter telluris]MBO0359681.1 30S ribosome-binding factor RbfA [Hymenobacter telluris]MBW3375708.1 30S ribosome-binding factor RbfA [Hymenobacter norwichensis]